MKYGPLQILQTAHYSVFFLNQGNKKKREEIGASYIANRNERWGGAAALESGSACLQKDRGQVSTRAKQFQEKLTSVETEVLTNTRTPCS